MTISMEELADQLDPEFPGPCYARLWRWRHRAAHLARNGAAPFAAPLARLLVAPTATGYAAPVTTDLEQFLRALALIRADHSKQQANGPTVDRDIAISALICRVTHVTATCPTPKRWCAWTVTGPQTAPTYGVTFIWHHHLGELADGMDRHGRHLWSVVDAYQAVTWRTPTPLPADAQPVSA